ncbi:pseudaminic acid cytidylyltransferase [Agarivorans gilvus]|uniref:Pseudaminic acid cytidylyltransferase n=1 Tax=Agarivorans gilvus TaxID=680279 RepID=A0ABQ1I4F1_9ALTE|nr:pseudaminic acid cytidylyltransferase [Agarivorans gilvus]GGB10467.1 pseudaminic acid cytidylyltransferase [Agarivorans gilvus]
MSNIAIIPARGGSKRIPHKNVKLFCGKPIIAYSIEAALNSGCFDKVIVSTDDPEIADIAAHHGAEIPFLRPPELSDDHATTTPVIQHALQHFLPQENFDFACCIYATAPFITPTWLKQSYQLLQQHDTEYSYPVVAFPAPIQRALEIEPASQTIRMSQPENVLLRSQDLPPRYYDSGQFYWGKSSAFLNATPILSAKAKALVLEKSSVVDIDDAQDWLIAENLYRSQYSQA